MDITILGAHNYESKHSKFACLLVDDVMALDAGGLTSSLTMQAQHKLKAILLSHKHYDHIRDIPAVAINFFSQGSTINIYSTQDVHDAIFKHLMNGKIYPDFSALPEANPAVKCFTVEPYKSERIEGYNVLVVPVNHDDVAVGYQVTSGDNKVIFYTGDTGPGLIECWKAVLPQLLFIEVTVPNRFLEFATKSRHLTPSLLEKELISFRELKGYLPSVIVVHMDPSMEGEIADEVSVVAKTLNVPITLAYEGMQLHI